MSRVIKFRAWDGKKVRYDVTGLEHGFEYEMEGVFLDGDYYKIADSDFGFNGKYFPHAALMQFTGLTDKNGRDVYEGDLIRRFIEGTEYNIKNHGISEDGQMELALIVWDEDELCFKERFRPWDRWWPLFERIRLCDSDFEVIGNWYENP